MLKRFFLLASIYSLYLVTSPLLLSEAVQVKQAEPSSSDSKSSETEKNTKSNDAALNPLAALSKAIHTISQKALPAVVNISTTQVIDQKDRFSDMPKFGPGSPFEDLFRDFFDQMEQQKPRKVQSLGSGFIIRIDGNTGYVVTNNHVVTDSKKTTIMLHDKSELEGTLHGSDERTDIAVIKIDLSKIPENKRPKALDWGKSDTAKVGDVVIAIGNAFGLGNTLTWGVISFKGRDLMTKKTAYVDDFIQHSAPINMGNSGGCLLDHYGEVIGINTVILTPSGGNVGIGFAIPRNVAKSTVDQLIEFGRTRRGCLGIQVQQIDKNMAESLGLKTKKGVIVGGITTDGPADKAGIKHSDVILEFDGYPLNDDNRISRLVGETTIGKKVTVKVWRNKKEIDIVVTIGEFEDKKLNKKSGLKKEKSSSSKIHGELGLKLSEIPDDVYKKDLKSSEIKGVYVLKIFPNSNAEESGLARGDVISEINQKPINSLDDFADIVNQVRKEGKKKNVLLFVSRNGEPRFITLKIDLPKENKNDQD